MKNLLGLLLILISFSGFGQDIGITLSTSQFSTHERLFLAPLDGWLFKSGNVADGSSQSLDVSDWSALNPSEINPDLADENGRVEGWFRLRFVLDDSFDGMDLGFAREFWAATDIYLNGDLIHSFGDTGNPYAAYNPILKYPVTLKLEVGKEYVLAIHFVDYETTFTQREIRMKPENYERLVSLTGPEYADRLTTDIKNTHIYGAIGIAVSFLLFFLFWLLVYLNRDQTIFKLIAWLTTFVLFTAILIFFNTFFDVSYSVEKLRFILMVTFQAVSTLFGLFVMEWMLTKKISIWSKVILVLMLTTNLLAHLFSVSPPFGIVFMGSLFFYGRLLYSHFKTIHGAQWAVVAGVVVPTILTLIYISIHKYSLDLFNEYDELLLTSSILSAPLFLLGYISARFKETLQNVYDEGQKVLKANEEKKEILANQNVVLEKQVDERTLELKNSLENLKSTQAQLIQSEKMASLGELTAGIAHEIQNPLNFVNNFSEVSAELVDEIQDIRRKTQDPSKASEEDEILEDIKQNLEKINHHGKRADSIVKGMLEHSRTSSGEKVPTDINALADEYLKLSYHGMRAKDKSFNADFSTDFDPNLPKVEVIPQDIGRVLLNVINNAFQACGNSEFRIQNSELKSKVEVSTKIKGDKIEISISDKGPGIPDAIKDKIFQPFFTTKPTGQGTGLGLSLSYDIVNAHGGELNVESQDYDGIHSGNTGTVFYILLPIL